MGRKKIRDKLYKVLGIQRDQRLKDVQDEMGPNGRLHPSLLAQQQSLKNSSGVMEANNSNNTGGYVKNSSKYANGYLPQSSSSKGTFQIHADYSPRGGKTRQNTIGSQSQNKTGQSGNATSVSYQQSATSVQSSINNGKAITGASAGENHGLSPDIQQLAEKLRFGDTASQALAAEQLFNVCQKESINRSYLYKLGVIEPLIGLLSSENQHAAVYSAFILSVVSPIEGAQTELLQYDAAGALLQLLIKQNVIIACKRGAIRSIARLSRLEVFVPEIVHKGGLETLQQVLLQCQDPTSSKNIDEYIIRRSLLSLYFLAADNQEVQNKIAQLGIVTNVLAICQNFTQDVQLEALDLLKVLCRNQNCGIIMICESNGLQILLGITRECSNVEIVNAAQKCLLRLQELDVIGDIVRRQLGEEFNQEETAKEEVDQFINCLHTTSGTLRGQVAAEVALVAEQDEPVQQSLLQTGAMCHLVDVLRDHNSSQESREAIVKAVYQMASKHNTRLQLLQYQVVPALVCAVPLLDEVNLMYASKTFNLLAQSQDCVKVMQSRDGTAAILEILERGSVEAQEYAVLALREIAGSSVFELLSSLQALPLLTGLIWTSMSLKLQVNVCVILNQLLLKPEALNQALACGLFQAIMSQYERHISQDLDQVYSKCLSTMLSQSHNQAQLISERALQQNITISVKAVENSIGERLPAWLEECIRMVPRDMFVGNQCKHLAYNNTSIYNNTGGVLLCSPEQDVRTLLALDIKPGMSVLDIGFGTGYMTALCAYLTQSYGECQAIEQSSDVYSYGQTNYWTALSQRRLHNVPQTQFVKENMYNILPSLGRFDRVYVGVQVHANDIPLLTRICNRSAGRLVVPVDGQLMLYRFEDGRESSQVIGFSDLPMAIQHQAPMQQYNLLPQPANTPQQSRDQVQGYRLVDDTARLANNFVNYGGQQPFQDNRYIPIDKQVLTPRAYTPPPARNYSRAGTPDVSRRSPAIHAAAGTPSRNGRSQSARRGGASQNTPMRNASKPNASYIDNNLKQVNNCSHKQQYQASNIQNDTVNDGIPLNMHNPVTPQQGLQLQARQSPQIHPMVGMQQSPAQKTKQRNNVSSASPNKVSLSPYALTMDDIQFCKTSDGKKCRLGEGGFGVVYKAHMNGVDEVAVKVVKAMDKATDKEIAQFDCEVRVLASLHHRNIVQFYGACLDIPHLFFVTELMKGGDLYSALRYHKDTMQWDVLGKKVALDVALGLNYLHTRRPPMMHRDLKSPNVLLSEEGVAKIADVGMVRSQSKELMTAQPVMTPLWAAPEVTRHERASIKADIWSYGILIWEIISGNDITEYAPLALSRQAETNRNMSKPKGKLMELPDKCPSVVRQIFNACTQQEPARRPTAAQITDMLRQSDKS